jgi:N-acetylmuramoyl-L-alanine amidase
MDMIKKMLAFFLLAAVGCSFLSFTGHRDNPRPAKLRTIIIDPGHGGLDPGTKGLISKEKDVALDISLKLGDAIQKEFPDIRIVYTRTTDILPGNAATLKEGLLNRADIANKAKGDLFICIHCNATRQPAGGYYAKRVIGHKKAIRYVKKKKKLVTVPIYESYWVKNTRIGTETYIWKADRSTNKSDAINEESEGEEDISDSANLAFDLSSPEGKMRAQLYEKRFFANSALFASLVEDEFQKTGRVSEGVKQRDEGIRVLQATGMPSVLIETGFLTNKEEEEYLNSEKGQEEVVTDIIEALKRYKEQVETHTSSLINTPADNN